MLSYIELIFIPIILFSSLYLLFIDFKKAIYLLLVLSLLLHKEDFSVYRWDVLPVRLFMVSLVIYTLVLLCAKLVKYKSLKPFLKSFYQNIKDPFLLFLSLLLGVRFISILFSQNISNSILFLTFFITIVTLGWLLFVNLKSNPEEVLKYIKFYIVAIFVICLIGFVQIFVFYKFDFTFGALWSVPNNLPRVGSLFWDVNHFAALLASVMPVLGVFILISKPTKYKFLYALMFFVMLIILLLTNSRTAWMLAFFSFISFVSVLFFKMLKFKGLLIVVFALVLISIPIFIEYSDTQSAFRAKVKNYFHYRLDSFESHIYLLNGSVEIFYEYPILGGGYGSFFEHFSKTDIAPTYFSRDPAGLNTRVPAHTIWGELLSETGVVGLAVYISLIGYISITLLYITFTSIEKSKVLLSTAMFSSIVGIHIGGIFYSYNSEFFWLIIFLYFIFAVAVLQNKYTPANIIKYFVNNENLPLIVISVISFILIFYKLGTNHLIVWDESIYAKIAKNMLASNEYLNMTWIQGKLWLEKPPLYIWMMAGFMKIFGVSEFAARLPSAIAGFLTVITVYFMGKKLYSKTVGFLAAFFLVTTFQFLYYARSSMMDVTTTFFIIASLYFYITNKVILNYKKLIISGFFIGCAIMTKGVIGFIPFMVITFYEIYLFIIKNQKINKDLIKQYLCLLVPSILVSAPWHLIMFYQHGKIFIDTYIKYHVIDRATTAIEDKGNPIWWYFIVLKVSMRFWFLILLGAIPSTIILTSKKARNFISKKYTIYFSDPKPDVFLLIGFISIFIFYSISKSKLVWYIMPVYPFAALLCALFIHRLIIFVTKFNYFAKLGIIYLIVIFGLVYVVAVKRDLVYTYDFTKKQATLLQAKDQIFGTGDTLYVDLVELPLILFYSDSPTQGVDYATLKQKIATVPYNQRFYFITKESRFRELSQTYTRLDLVQQEDEWALAYLPSQFELDSDELKQLQGEYDRVQKGSEPEPAKTNHLNIIQSQIDELSQIISSGLLQSEQ